MPSLVASEPVFAPLSRGIHHCTHVFQQATMSHERTDHHDDESAADDRTDVEVPGGERLVVEFAVPTDDFLLASALSTLPDLAVEFEQVVPTDSDPLKYLWTTDCDPAAFEEAATADPTVERARRVAVFDQGALYELAWDGLAEREGLFEWIRDREATVLQSESLDGEWLLKLRLPSRETLGDLRTHCRDNGVDFRIVRLFSLTEPKMGQFNVSAKQREVLLTGLRMGYFEIPRETTLGEVADAIGISPNSASERLRRAQTSLLNNTLTVGQPTGIGLG